MAEVEAETRLVILVQYRRTDTTREWLAMTRTTRTDRETMVYGSYTNKSWNNGDLHIISKTVVQQYHRLRASMVYESYSWWSAYHMQ